MTIEQGLPWLSLAAALGAVGARVLARPRLDGVLRALAFAALAVFAYFRWISPAAIPLALTLETLGQIALPWEGRRWRKLAVVFPIAGWLMLIQLFWATGDGRLSVFADAGKAGLLILLLAGFVLGMRLIRGRVPRPRIGLAVGAGALFIMAVMALTLDWGLWPALAGAAATLLAQGLLLVGEDPERSDLPERLGRTRRLQAASWALAYAGYAAIAYAFMR